MYRRVKKKEMTSVAFFFIVILILGEGGGGRDCLNRSPSYIQYMYSTYIAVKDVKTSECLFLLDNSMEQILDFFGLIFCCVYLLLFQFQSFFGGNIFIIYTVQQA
jgi:hypothetical protein